MNAKSGPFCDQSTCSLTNIDLHDHPPTFRSSIYMFWQLATITEPGYHSISGAMIALRGHFFNMGKWEIDYSVPGSSIQRVPPANKMCNILVLGCLNYPLDGLSLIFSSHRAFQRQDFLQLIMKREHVLCNNSFNNTVWLRQYEYTEDIETSVDQYERVEHAALVISG